MKELPIHPVQYLLVGFGLAIFFLLLVSLSEHMAFALSYLIASVVFETATPFETPGWMKDLVDWFNQSCQPFSSSSSSISSALRTAGNSSALRKYSILSLSVALG